MSNIYCQILKQKRPGTLLQSFQKTFGHAYSPLNSANLSLLTEATVLNMHFRHKNQGWLKKTVKNWCRKKS